MSVIADGYTRWLAAPRALQRPTLDCGCPADVETFLVGCCLYRCCPACADRPHTCKRPPAKEFPNPAGSWLA